MQSSAYRPSHTCEKGLEGIKGYEAVTSWSCRSVRVWVKEWQLAPGNPDTSFEIKTVHSHKYNTALSKAYVTQGLLSDISS